MRWLTGEEEHFLNSDENKVADYGRRATSQAAPSHNKVTEFEKCSSLPVSLLVVTLLCQPQLAIKYPVIIR